VWALEEHLFGLGSFLEVDLVTGLGDNWDISFVRAFNDWEVEIVASFFTY
jgi:hypothetical protein